MKKSKDYMAAETLVRWLGLSCNSVGVRQFILALVLIHRDSDQRNPASLIQNVSTKLYPLIAEEYPSATGAGVERNLRAVRTKLVDRGDRDRLETMLGFPVRVPPSVGELLDHANFYMERNGLWPDEE